jgi:hypothetical protein
VLVISPERRALIRKLALGTTPVFTISWTTTYRPGGAGTHGCAVLRVLLPENFQGRDGWIGGEDVGLVTASHACVGCRGPGRDTRSLRLRPGLSCSALLSETCSTQGAIVRSVRC